MSILERENEDGEIDTIPILKIFTVFNVEQIDGFSLSTEAVSPAETFEPFYRLKTCCVAVVPYRNEREVCRLRAAKSRRILQTVFLLPVVTVTVERALLVRSREAGINLSATLDAELRRYEAKKWQEENRHAIDALNRFHDENGCFSDEYRTF